VAALRTLVTDAVLAVDRENDRAEVELFWQGGAQTRLMVKLNRRPAKRTDTPKDLVELIARLAEHSNDREIAMVLSKQGLLTATELPFTEARVAGIRERAGIPAARVRAGGDGISIRAAALELGVSTQTIRRWIREGLLPAAQTTPHAPWRICLTDDTRAKFKPDVPDGYLSLEMAARTPDSHAKPSSTRCAPANATRSRSSTASAEDYASTSPTPTRCAKTATAPANRHRRDVAQDRSHVCQRHAAEIDGGQGTDEGEAVGQAAAPRQARQHRTS
jgi:hypothetical protein